MPSYKIESKQFADAMSMLIIRMKSVDDSCVSLMEDISIKEMHLVIHVGESERIIMRDIANFMDIPMSTATGIVDKLVDKKYLTRSHSPLDRRIVQIELDKEGKACFETLTTMKLNLADTILGLLNPNEVETFMAILNKVNIGLEKAVETA